MPLSGIAELIVQPVIEGIAQVLCYFTSRVIVPLFSLGRAYVEPGPQKKFVVPKLGRIQKHGSYYIVEAELGALFGLFFWFAIGGGIVYFKSF